MSTMPIDELSEYYEDILFRMLKAKKNGQDYDEDEAAEAADGWIAIEMYRSGTDVETILKTVELPHESHVVWDGKKLSVEMRFVDE